MSSAPATVVAVYEALAADLRAMGVDRVFGLMSDDTALLGAAIDATGITFVTTRHENQAVAAAEGWAAATRRTGVALLGRGPATASDLHGIGYARRSGSPVLVILGEAPRAQPPNAMGPDTKALDAVGVLRGAGLPTYVAHDAMVA